MRAVRRNDVLYVSMNLEDGRIQFRTCTNCEATWWEHGGVRDRAYGRADRHPQALVAATGPTAERAVSLLG
jgi:hypothetical protein